MQTEDKEQLRADAEKFLKDSENLARKIGELAKSEGVSTTVFIFSLFACVSAAEQMTPSTFRSVKQFYDAVTDTDINETKKERGN